MESRNNKGEAGADDHNTTLDTSVLEKSEGLTELNQETSSHRPQTTSVDYSTRTLFQETSTEKPSDDVEMAKEAEEEAKVNPNIVDWDGPDDPQNPVNWSATMRWLHIGFASLSCLMVNLASSMYAPATALVIGEFAIKDTMVGSFTVTMYLLGFAVGPMIIAPLSEMYGRRVIYHVSGLVFVLANVGCALSNGVGMLFAFRFLAGCAGSAPQTVGGGTISDVVKPEERGKAMAIFGLGPLFGPVIGPIAGAFEASAIGWRWIFWTLAIAMGVVTGASMTFMRETYPVVLLNQKAERLRKETGNQDLISKHDLGMGRRNLMKLAIIRPLKMLIFSPVVLLLSLYMAFVIALTFLFFTTFAEVFQKQYNFGPKVIGLVYIGMGLGQAAALVIFGIYSDKIQIKLNAKFGPRPENRLPLMIYFPATVIVGLLLYGWTAEYQAHWILPIIGTAFCGFGVFFITMSVLSYLIETYPMYAASAFAANTLIRSLLSCFFPLAGPGVYASLGYGWGNTLLAGVTSLFLPMGWVFYTYGERLRKRFPLEL